MSPTEVDALVEQWMVAELDKTEELRDTTHFSAEDRDFMADLAADRYQDALETNGRDPAYLAPEAEAVLRAAGVPLLDHETRAFKRLCRKLQIANLEVLGIELERWQGIYKNGHRPAVAVPVTPPVKMPDSPMFSDVAARYFKEKKRSKKTEKQVQAEYARFLTAIGGDRPIATITKQDCRKYKDTLVAQQLTPATIAVRMFLLSGVFTWASEQGYTPEGALHPVEGLAPKKEERDKDAKRIMPFTNAQLLTVFDTSQFLKQRNKPERWWVPLLALFQLCRREEACQLAIKGIGTQDGIHYMNITDGPGQSLKNKGSRRTIPIHSSLIELGFLQYVASIKKQGHD